jgi:glycosyltransferase involved in cell wall biosynthesis
MPIHTLSILIPCFNEENTIGAVLKKIVEAECGLNKEIIIVNDGSTDNTATIIEQFIQLNQSKNIRELANEKNKGKGYSMQKAIEAATGEVIIIQDADLEYNPFEYQKMLKPITDGYADVVYGSRFRGGEAHRVLFFFHTIGNKLLTFLSNLFTGLNLSDMETGYKMFKTGIIRQINLKEKRFGFEPEITAKISKIKNIRIYEVGISYYGRTYQEGKKIRWRDGLRAIYCIFKYNLFSSK